jgi:uncharacterized protein YndB with AHSA1/START domain/uncharacterized protein YciI
MHFFARLLGPRPTFPYDINPGEEEIMKEHADYLRELTARRKMLLAGPVFESPVFGLAVLQTATEEEARQIMENDPSVRKGLNTYVMHAMRASFFAENLPSDRYVQQPSDRVVRKDVIVPASREDVWRAWTTSEGARTFFSSDAHIELRLGGPYEIYFLRDNPYGLQGTEDCRILGYLPLEMLLFEWNAPPEFEALRAKRTVVIVQLSDTGSGETRVELSHLGWGIGDRWDGLVSYFDRAWGYVLNNLKKRFAEGPIKWTEEQA